MIDQDETIKLPVGIPQENIHSTCQLLDRATQAYWLNGGDTPC